ncbi:hypothetical protein [Aliiglaciecola sp. NS0011-25]|uniref:hypothetical protein n=1 Tax=Aliiglaciecola sp. NS0011-25 TaxID=3127654 RepID=UPI003106FD50
MPSSTKKAAGNPVITRALANSSRGLSRGRPVLRYNSYIESYTPEQLPKITTRKQLYKTHCLDAKKHHYINYGLRAAVLGLLEAANNDKTNTKHVTVQLNEGFSKRVIDESGTRGSAQYFNRMFRMRIAAPLNIANYFFVFETSQRGNLHVHIVLNIDESEVGRLKELLKSSGWLQTDNLGKVSNSAIKVDSGYPVRLFRNAMSLEEIEYIEMEVEDYSDDSLWQCVRKKADDKGNIVCQEYQLKEHHTIDEGLADYLCKDLTDSLFYGGKNYGISRSLKSHMKPYIEQVISKDKKHKS